jgi:hypothetical protein
MTVGAARACVLRVIGCMQLAHLTAGPPFCCAQRRNMQVLSQQRPPAYAAFTAWLQQQVSSTWFKERVVCGCTR